MYASVAGRRGRGLKGDVDSNERSQKCEQGAQRGVWVLYQLDDNVYE